MRRFDWCSWMTLPSQPFCSRTFCSSCRFSSHLQHLNIHERIVTSFKTKANRSKLLRKNHNLDLQEGQTPSVQCSWRTSRKFSQRTERWGSRRPLHRQPPKQIQIILFGCHYALVHSVTVLVKNAWSRHVYEIILFWSIFMSWQTDTHLIEWKQQRHVAVNSVFRFELPENQHPMFYYFCCWRELLVLLLLSSLNSFPGRRKLDEDSVFWNSSFLVQSNQFLRFLHLSVFVKAQSKSQ